MRKRRSDSGLNRLSEAQEAQVAEWMLSGLAYHKVGELCEKEFGVPLSERALRSFWQEVCVPLLLARRSRAVQTAKEIGDDARSRPGQFDAATVDLLQQ